jgi:predicted extracellular nuclease
VLLAGALLAWLGGPLASAAPSPFGSLAECERYLAERPRQRSRPPRVGTWNIRWFPLGTASGKDPERHTDVPWLACAIAALEVDVLAMQEITQGPRGRAAVLDLIEALDARTGGKHRFEVDECPGDGRQHIGFLYDERRVKLSQVRMVAAVNPGASACDRNLRPGLAAYARFASGPDLHLLTAHLDSGQTERDYGHRARSVARLGEALAELRRDEPDADAVVLGDFNTMGCKKCSGGEVTADQELEQIDAALAASELRRLTLPEGRQCSHYYGNRAGLLDHALADTRMQELARVPVDVFGPCRELGCERVPSTFGPASIERLSDHCPLVVELVASDRDSPAAKGPRPTRR